MTTEKDFADFLLGKADLECTHCGALLWILRVERVPGQPLLMRAGEIHHDDCPICSEIHEMMA